MVFPSRTDRPATRLTEGSQTPTQALQNVSSARAVDRQRWALGAYKSGELRLQSFDLGRQFE